MGSTSELALKSALNTITSKMNQNGKYFDYMPIRKEKYIKYVMLELNDILNKLSDNEVDVYKYIDFFRNIVLQIYCFNHNFIKQIIQHYQKKIFDHHKKNNTTDVIELKFDEYEEIKMIDMKYKYLRIEDNVTDPPKLYHNDKFHNQMYEDHLKRFKFLKGTSDNIESKSIRDAKKIEEEAEKEAQREAETKNETLYIKEVNKKSTQLDINIKEKTEKVEEAKLKVTEAEKKVKEAKEAKELKEKTAEAKIALKKAEIELRQAETDEKKAKKNLQQLISNKASHEGPGTMIKRMFKEVMLIADKSGASNVLDGRKGCNFEFSLQDIIDNINTYLETSRMDKSCCDRECKKKYPEVMGTFRKIARSAKVKTCKVRCRHFKKYRGKTCKIEGGSRKSRKKKKHTFS